MIWWILGYFVIGVIILVNLSAITINRLICGENEDDIISMATESKSMKVINKVMDIFEIANDAWIKVLYVIFWPVVSIYMMMFNREIKRILQGECEKKIDHNGSENT